MTRVRVESFTSSLDGYGAVRIKALTIHSALAERICTSG